MRLNNIINAVIYLCLASSCVGSLLCVNHLYYYDIQTMWQQAQIKAPQDLVAPLSGEQVSCIQNVTEIENLSYARFEETDHYLAIAYTSIDEYKVAILTIDKNGVCLPEFHQTLNHGQYKYTTEYLTIFQDIKWRDFTNDEIPDVYIWFKSYPYRYRGETHIFYVKQPDGLYKDIEEFILCRDWNSIEFINQNTILVENDQLCGDNPSANYKSQYKVILSNDGSEIIRN